MGKIISLLNHKGGVGKTTSAINIAAGLAKLGKQVLLVDLDAQANVGLSLGIPRQKFTIYEALRGESELVPFNYKEGLDVVTSTLDLSGAEMELINEAGREYILRELFDSVQDDYDFIILDCPPSLGLLTLNALTSSDFVYIPLQTQFLALQGLAKMKQVIDKVRFRLNKKLEIGGVIATMYDSRKVLNRDVVDTIRKYFGDKVFKTLIRNNISLAEAPAQRMDIFTYSASSNGAKDYLNLCKEILERTGHSEKPFVTMQSQQSAVKQAPVATASTEEEIEVQL